MDLSWQPNSYSWVLTGMTPAITVSIEIFLFVEDNSINKALIVILVAESWQSNCSKIAIYFHFYRYSNI